MKQKQNLQKMQILLVKCNFETNLELLLKIMVPSYLDGLLLSKFKISRILGNHVDGALKMDYPVALIYIYLPPQKKISFTHPFLLIDTNFLGNMSTKPNEARRGPKGRWKHGSAPRQCFWGNIQSVHYQRCND